MSLVIQFVYSLSGFFSQLNIINSNYQWRKITVLDAECDSFQLSAFFPMRQAFWYLWECVWQLMTGTRTHYQDLPRPPLDHWGFPTWHQVAHYNKNFNPLVWTHEMYPLEMQLRLGIKDRNKKLIVISLFVCCCVQWRNPIPQPLTKVTRGFQLYLK